MPAVVIWTDGYEQAVRVTDKDPEEILKDIVTHIKDDLGYDAAVERRDTQEGVEGPVIHVEIAQQEEDGDTETNLIASIAGFSVANVRWGVKLADQTLDVPACLD